MNAGLRTRHSRASGLLTLPSSSGVISVSIQDVPVVASLPSDLMLGVDWFQFLCGSDSGSEVIVYLSSGPLELRQRLVPLTQETEAPLPTGMLHLQLSFRYVERRDLKCINEFFAILSRESLKPPSLINFLVKQFGPLN
jgi:hypothetical protein